jgi:hypothetical protein
MLPTALGVSAGFYTVFNSIDLHRALLVLVSIPPVVLLFSATLYAAKAVLPSRAYQRAPLAGYVDQLRSCQAMTDESAAAHWEAIEHMTANYLGAADAAARENERRLDLIRSAGVRTVWAAAYTGIVAVLHIWS